VRLRGSLPSQVDPAGFLAPPPPIPPGRTLTSPDAAAASQIR
jgi:hypothetical protein